MEACDKNIDKVATRASKKANKPVTKPASRDSSPEESICRGLSNMTLEERERQVLTDIAAIKLENRVAELELERERLLQKREKGYTISSSRRCVATHGPDESRRRKEAILTVGRMVEETEDGFVSSDE